MRKIAFFFCFISASLVKGEELKASYDVALFALNNKSLDSAKIEALSLLSLAKAENNNFYLVKSYYLLGYISAEIEDFGDAVIYYLEGARFAESQRDKEIQKDLISINKNLGNILGNYGHFELAHKFIDKGLDIARKTKNTNQEIRLLSNRVHEYLEEKRYEEAILEIERIFDAFELELGLTISLKNKAGIAYQGLNDLDKAKSNYQYILDYAPKEDRYYAFALHNIGEILLIQENYHEAIPYIEKAIKLGHKASFKEELISSYCNLAKVYLAKGDHQTALKYLLQAQVTDKSVVSRTSANTHYLYDLISQTYEKSGEPLKALEFKSIYSRRLEDFIADQKKIEELDKKHSIQLLTEKYFDILAANEEKKQSERMAQLGLGGSALLLLVILIIYLRYRWIRYVIQRDIAKIERLSKV